MTESQKVIAESKAMLVDSEYFNDVIYAIDRSGKGIRIICGNVELPILAENVVKFAEEVFAVWQHMKPRTLGKERKRNGD